MRINKALGKSTYVLAIKGRNFSRGEVKIFELKSGNEDAVMQWGSELTSVHVPYRTTRTFWYRYTNYRFTRFTQNTRFTRENETISSASEMSIKVTRGSLAGLKITRKGMKWSWHSGKKELEQGIKHLVLDIQVSSVSVESMFSFRNLRCDDRRNRVLPTNLEKTVKMRFLNEFS